MMWTLKETFSDVLSNNPLVSLSYLLYFRVMEFRVGEGGGGGIHPNPSVLEAQKKTSLNRVKNR